MPEFIAPYWHPRLTQYLVLELSLACLYWNPGWRIKNGLFGLRLQIRCSPWLNIDFSHIKCTEKEYFVFFFLFLSFFSDSSSQKVEFPRDGGGILAWRKEETTTHFSSCTESCSPSCAICLQANKAQLLRSIFMCTNHGIFQILFLQLRLGQYSHFLLSAVMACWSEDFKAEIGNFPVI